MSFIPVKFEDCPWTPDGGRPVPFSRLDLEHAAVAVGRNWRLRARTTEDHHHIQARIHDIHSAVNIAVGGAQVTQHYRNIGSTARGTKSFSIGNAFCALIAAKELHVPWLVDLENLTHRHHVRWRSGRKRADFLGRAPSGEWYVFEAKGRSRPPSDDSINEWKDNQACSVRRVNGRNPAARIVSATYAKADDSLHAIWRDPPADEGEDIKVEAKDFLSAYYTPLFNLIERADQHQNVQGFRLAVLPEAHLSVGVHPLVQQALAGRNPEQLWSFAVEQREAKGQTSSRDETFRVFPDGLIIKLHLNRPRNHVVMDE